MIRKEEWADVVVCLLFISFCMYGIALYSPHMGLGSSFCHVESGSVIQGDVTWKASYDVYCTEDQSTIRISTEYKFLEKSHAEYFLKHKTHERICHLQGGAKKVGKCQTSDIPYIANYMEDLSFYNFIVSLSILFFWTGLIIYLVKYITDPSVELGVIRFLLQIYVGPRLGTQKPNDNDQGQDVLE
jgi:hypothetical protein